MKRYILSLTLASLLVSADEIQRIESIVKDITQLRTQYKECQEKLALTSPCDTYSLEKQIKDEQQKNLLLLSELDSCTNSHKENEKLKYRILELEKSNIELEDILKSKYEEILSAKEKRIKDLENQINNKQKPQKSLFNQFPKLVMKEDRTRKTPSKKEQEQDIVEEQTQPSAYRLKHESDIYNSVAGDVIDRWEEERSFTSNIKYKNWIKITGYFVDKKWRKAGEDLWILEENVLKRD